MQAQDIRYIQNPFKKILNIIQPDHPKLYHILYNLIQQFINKVPLPTLQDISSDPKQTTIDISAYTGANGYLYTLIRLYNHFYYQKYINKQKLLTKENKQIILQSIKVEDRVSAKLEDPDYYLGLAFEQYLLIRKFIQKNIKKSKNFAFYMSQTCTWLCGLHLGYIKKDNELFRYNQNKLIECYNQYKKTKDQVHHQYQVLYGIPGFLYTILQAQNNYDKSQEQLFRTNFKNISKSLTIDIINIGILQYQKSTKSKVKLQKLPQDFRLVYKFYKKQYLGGAHGLGGNLNIILLSMKMNNFSQKVQQIFQLISASIKFLIKHFINKNFSTSAGSQKTKLVHFCHGAPGIISSLARFQVMFPQKGIQMGIRQIIEASLNNIWNYGILKKGFGLCHGISGNAYSFIYPAITDLFPQKVLENRRKAILFALLRQEKQIMNQIKQIQSQDRYVKGKSDSPYSLMIGISGDICLIIDLIQGKARFPGFDF